MRSPSAATEVTEEIKLVGGSYHLYPYDLADREQVLKIVPDMISYGHGIDIFIHCAGIQHRCAAAEFPDTQWDNIMAVNVTAGFQLARDLAKHWFDTSLKEFNVKTGLRKKVIFIASVLTFGGGHETPAYTASKGAIGQLTKALNNEWMAKGVSVNAIAPGYIQTELTSGLRDAGVKEDAIIQRVPAGRWGIPEDLAGAVIHLSSKSSDFIGGEILAVDGGFLAR